MRPPPALRQAGQGRRDLFGRQGRRAQHKLRRCRERGQRGVARHGTAGALAPLDPPARRLRGRGTEPLGAPSASSWRAPNRLTSSRAGQRSSLAARLRLPQFTARSSRSRLRQRHQAQKTRRWGPGGAPCRCSSVHGPRHASWRPHRAGTRVGIRHAAPRLAGPARRAPAPQRDGSQLAAVADVQALQFVGHQDELPAGGGPATHPCLRAAAVHERRVAGRQRKLRHLHDDRPQAWCTLPCACIQV